MTTDHDEWARYIIQADIYEFASHLKLPSSLIPPLNHPTRSQIDWVIETLVIAYNKTIIYPKINRVCFLSCLWYAYEKCFSPSATDPVDCFTHKWLELRVVFVRCRRRRRRRRHLNANREAKGPANVLPVSNRAARK